MVKTSFLRLLSNIISYSRLKIWQYYYNDKNIIELKLIKGNSAKFYAYGDIVRFLYCDQLLVDYKRSFEYETLELFTGLLKPDSIVLDIGANIGLFSVLASKYVTGKGKIYAIEPTTKTFDFLKKNLEINSISNVEAFKVAFSNTKSLVSMTPPQHALTSRFGDSFNQIREITDPEQNTDTIETSIFDEFIFEQNIKNIDVIKMDIEGAELFCLQGATNFLKSPHKPTIIFECFEPHCEGFGYKVVDVLILLENAGYDVKQYAYFQWIATPKI